MSNAAPEDRDWARPVVHWEIEARDAEAQKAFYAALFNWVVGEGSIMNIEPGLGGPEPGPAGHIRQSDQSRISLYVQVGDLAATLARVPELGGTVTMEAIDIPGGPTIAGIEDPESNPIALVQQ